MEDTLKIVHEALKLAQEAQKPQGLSDTVILSIVAGIVGMATIIIKGIIESHAKKAEVIAAAAVSAAATVAKAESEKITQKLETVEIKIDGRLSQLIESYKREGELKEIKGHKEGKEEAKKEEIDRKQETPPATPAVQLPGATKLKILEGEIRVTPSEAKKKG